ncbi:MAG: glycosyltransferase [Acidobacteria bacterium]|nr:glycosyltransferase [Acidobacteriota bacterium]
MKPSVVISIPCYNEEHVLASSLGRVHAHCTDRLGDYAWTLVIADNASTDRTPEIGRRLAGELPGVEYFRSDRKGRGQALRACWTSIPADVHAYMDSDLATELTFLGPLLDAVRDGADAAIGCRLTAGARVIGRSLSREISSRGYNRVLKLFFRVRFRDAQCGFKAVGRRVLERVVPRTRDDHWFFDSEMLILSERMGFIIREVPVTWEEHMQRDTRVKLFRDISFFIRQVLKLRRRLWFDPETRSAVRCAREG